LSRVACLCIYMTTKQNTVEMDRVGTVVSGGHVYQPYPYEPRLFGVPHRLISPRHFFAGFIMLGIAIAAAVGLAQVDWYVIESTVPTGAYVTWYLGLGSLLSCPTPAGYVIAHGNIGPSSVGGAGAGAAGCVLYRYNSLYKDSADFGSDDQRYFFHLLGASSIITALLALLCLLGFVGAMLNFVAAFHRHYRVWADNKGSHHRGAKSLMWISLIIELLVIIFWVTIFPYTQWFGQRDNLGNGSHFTPVGSTVNSLTSGFDSYWTLGSGFILQIVGFFLALLGVALLRRKYVDHTAGLPAPGTTAATV